MEKYKVMCVKYGFTIVEAKDEDDAVDIAEMLPTSSYEWHGTEEHQVIEN